MKTNKKLKSYYNYSKTRKPIDYDEETEDMSFEAQKHTNLRTKKKNPNLTFIGGLVIGFILGLFAGAVFISNVML